MAIYALWLRALASGIIDAWTVRMVFLGFGKCARADKIYALRADHRRQSRRRPADARLGRGCSRSDRGLADGADDPARHGTGCRPARRSWTRRSRSPRRLAEDASSGRVDLGRSRPPGTQAARVVEQAARELAALLDAPARVLRPERPRGRAGADRRARCSSNGVGGPIVEAEAYESAVDPSSARLSRPDAEERVDVRPARAARTSTARTGSTGA